MIPPDKSYAAARLTCELARSRLIDATFELPADPPADVLELWTAADSALLAFIRRLEEAEKAAANVA